MIFEEEIKKQKNIARELRKTTWWKRKCACGTCHYCNAKVPPKQLTMDHIVPLAQGGKSVKSNLVTACRDCNNKKKDLLPMDWEEYMGRLV